MNGIVSINGEITPLEQAKISVLDRGFLFGDAIFEVLVGFKSKLIATTEHLNRLRFSASSIGFKLPWSDEDLSKEISELSRLANFPKTYLRIGVTRGEGLGLVPVSSTYTKLLYALPAKPASESVYSNGVSLKTLPKPTYYRGPQIKTPYYLPSIVAMQGFKEGTFDDVLWVNSEQEITEASTSNIFFIGREGNQTFVETPSLESGLLSGVTRGIILKLLTENKIAWRETPILEEELARFDEAFLCSTIRGIVPIRRIDDKTFGTARPTASTQRIRNIFQSWIEEQIGEKFDWNTGL